MTGLLPPGMRCSAYWYALRSGLVSGSGDLDFLRCLGWHAARLARWQGIPPWQVPEGPYLVFMWPEQVWDAAWAVMARAAAQHGDYASLGHGYQDAGGYG